MSENVIQTSFSAGELSPNLFARVDFAKYRSGCAVMRNFFVDYRSGASTRPGTEFIRPAYGNIVRLVRFQQSATVTYVLEMGHGYIRFISNGASVVEGAVGISSVTSGLGALVTAPGHAYGNGDLVFISGVSGIPQINNRYFIVTNSVPGVSFDILDSLTVAPVNSTSWPPGGSGGIIQRVYTIATPYQQQHLALLKFSQKASVMNITHPNYRPHKLQLFSATNWQLSPATFGATVPPPGAISVFPSGGGPAVYKYAVTSVDAENQESVPGPIGITGSVLDLRVTAGTNLVQWSNVPEAFVYNVYGSSPSYVGQAGDATGLGFMGSIVSPTAQFLDSNIAPDFSQTPPVHEDPFANVNPAVSSYFQQRLVYANGGGNLVATFWASKTGAPYNFDVSSPTQANDAITGTLVSLEVNEIKSLVPMSTGLIALTSTGAWQINGGAGGVATQGGPITPVTATATPQSYIGANDLPPIVINYDIIFVQSKGSIVRDMTFNIYANIYTGNDISILSSHMFYNHQINEWAYSEEPFKSVWCVRDDGILLNLTLVKEQDMYGWSRHDTQGNFMSVCTVTEGSVDATYVVVERTLSNGLRRIQVERFAERTFPFGAEDSWAVDAALTTTSHFPNGTLTFSAATGEITVSSTVAFWVPAHVGWVIRFGGGIINLTSYISSSVLGGTVVKPIEDLIPNDPLGRPDIAIPGSWSLTFPTMKLYGLDHLEGKEVGVVADGGVVNGLVVQDGSIDLPYPASKVTAGLRFQSQLQTMPLDLGSEINSVQGKRKKVGALTVRVKDSRGVKAGRTFETVTPIKQLNRTTAMGLSIPLITADERIVMDPLWDVPGQICIQVDDPLPVTILGIIPEVIVGDTGK